MYEFAESSFAFLPMLRIAPTEVHDLHLAPCIRRSVRASDVERRFVYEGPLLL